MPFRPPLLRLVAPLILAAFGSATIFASAASADSGYAVQSVAAWKQNAAPVGWSSSLNRVVYNSFGSDGLFNAYTANPDGSDPRCLTCTLPSFAGVGTATNRGASDVSPDGKYVLVTVEGVHVGQGASWTQPGSGGGNDVYLYSADGQHAWPLTDITAPGQLAFGTIWPRFDRTGNEIVWSSMYAPALVNLGYWQLKVANIVWNNGIPSLANVRTIEPATNTFYEPYGFSPDDLRIIFASNAEQPSIADDQIDTINVDGTGLTQLTKPNPASLLNYNEFAWYTPDNSIIYGTTRDATSGGMDYWAMNGDGSNPQRLTYFNQPWHTESLGYSIGEGLAFNPNNPDQFIATVASDFSSEDVNAEIVNLAPAEGNGLTERFYSGQSFGQLLYTTTQNPSDGFDADASPAPGVPSTNYSIKWTGALVPPSTGTYTLCIVADASAQLYLSGKELINGWYSFGKRHCATVSQTAGSRVPIEFDYEQGLGAAWAQLSWIPPGGSTPSLIPSTAFAATANGNQVRPTSKTGKHAKKSVKRGRHHHKAHRRRRG